MHSSPGRALASSPSASCTLLQIMPLQKLSLNSLAGDTQLPTGADTSLVVAHEHGYEPSSTSTLLQNVKRQACWHPW